MNNEMDIIKYDSHDISVECSNSTLIIRYPNITYSYWKTRIPYDSDKDIITILLNLLVYLDCTITFSNQRLLFTNHMMYDYHVSEYYYYLLRIDNQYLYNKYLNRLLIRHEENIKFEIDNPIVPHVPKTKIKKEPKVKASSKFVRQITTDLITGGELYIYSNSKTGEVLNSTDPNLLDSLNGVKPKKEKKVKQVGVPISNMTFTFKKKTND